MKLMLARVLCLLAAATFLPSCLKAGSVATQALVAPSTLIALPTSDGSAIDLAWVDNSDNETGFRVDVAPGPINADSDVTEYTILPANTSAYSYPTQPNSTRYFRVLAVTSAVQSSPSNVVSASTPNVPPPPQRFDALVGPSGSDTIVTLLWDDTATETSYTIDRSANGGAWNTLASPGQNVTSFSDSTTSPNGDYAYRIRANNANGSGPWSPIVRAQTRNTSWELLSSPPSGDISWYTSLAVGTSGSTFIASYDASLGVIAHSTSSIGSGIFTTEINPGYPATLGFTGTSIALDANGFSSHIVANDTFANTLVHLTNISGSWVVDTIDSPTVNTDRALIKSGPSNSIHVVYQHQNSGMISGLRYAARSGTSWTTEWITTSDPTDYFALVVDLAGTVHLAYRRPAGGAYELIYAKRAGGAWTFDTVPTSGSPEMCSIALAPSGAVYIAYNSLTTGGLNLVNNSGGSWTEEVVHHSPLARWGRYNSLAIDNYTGEIHVAYQEAIYTSLRYASRLPGGAWVYQHVDGAGDVGRFSSLGTDSNGNVFIAYGDATNQRVKLGRTALRPPGNLIATPINLSRIDLTWSDVPNEKSYRVERSLDGGINWATLTTVAANAVAYGDTGLTSSQLYSYRVIATNDFGESAPSNVVSTLPCFLATVSLPSSSDFGVWNDLAVSGTTLYVASSDQTNTNQIVTMGSAGGPFTTITSDSGPSPSSAVGFGSNGIGVSGSTVVTVAELANAGIGAFGGLRFTTITGTTPSSTTLEASSGTTFVGQYPKVRVAPNGTIHVLHLEAGNGGSYWRHAIRTGGTWTFAGRMTPLELIAGHYNNNLAIDSSSNPHLAYVRRPSSAAPFQLVYGAKQAGTWSFTVLPGPVNPFFPSFALDGNDKAHVVYIDNSGTNVGYGTNASGSWVFETLDPSITSTTYNNAAIAVDPVSGRVHVVYPSAGLRYARKDPGGIWFKEQLDTTSAFQSISIGLGASGMIHVAYQDYVTKRLKILSAQP
jgi:hypothetical protein